MSDIVAKAEAAGYKSLGIVLPSLIAPGPKASKYRNVRTIYNGVRYDSKAEASRAEVLDLMVRSGEFSWWIGQPKFRLGVPENVYVADFLVRGRGGEVWAEDVKGVETAKFRRDKVLWRAYGPFPLRIICGGVHTLIRPEGRS